MPKAKVEVVGPEVRAGGVKVAVLAESPRFREHYRVLALDGSRIGYVFRPFTRLNWKLEPCSRASYRTLEAALAALLRKVRRF